MKRAFKNIPKVVRKQIWLRMAVGAVFLLFFITTWISTGQFRIGLMLLLFATLILVNGGVMIYNCVISEEEACRSIANRYRYDARCLFATKIE